MTRSRAPRASNRTWPRRRAGYDLDLVNLTLFRNITEVLGVDWPRPDWGRVEEDSPLQCGVSRVLAG
jgi:hypothetical protein